VSDTDERAQIDRVLAQTGGGILRAARAARERLTPPAAEAVAAWLAWLHVQKGLGELSAYRYARTVIDFLAEVETRGGTLSTVHGQDIEAFMRGKYLGRGVSATSQATYLAALRSFFAWQSARTFGPNPTASIPSPRRRQRLPRRFTHEDIRALFATCDRDTMMGARDLCALSLALVTGGRRAELAALDLEDLELTPRRGYVRFQGKGDKERIVPFADAFALQALRDWLTMRDRLEPLDRSALFVALNHTRRGRRLGLDGFDGVMRRAVRQAKLRLPPSMALHALRATFASELYDAGIGLEHVRLLLGHADLNTTRRYIALSRKQQRAMLPAEFTDRILGRNVIDLPLWARQRLRTRGEDSSS